MMDNGRALYANAAKIFAIAAVGVLAIGAVISLLDQLGMAHSRHVLAMGLVPAAVYVAISLFARTGDLASFEVADRSVPSLWNGINAAAVALPASFLFALAGILYALGFDGLPYVIGWTAGFALAAVAIGPYLQMSGARTIAGFFSLRFGRAAGVLA